MAILLSTLSCVTVSVSNKEEKYNAVSLTKPLFKLRLLKKHYKFHCLQFEDIRLEFWF